MSQTETVVAPLGDFTVHPEMLSAKEHSLIKQVVVKCRSNHVEIFLSSPFSNRDPGALKTMFDESDVSPSADVGMVEWLKNVLKIHQFCQSVFQEQGAQVVFVPPLVGQNISLHQVHALFLTLIEVYADLEPLAGNWLKKADIQVRVDADKLFSVEDSGKYFITVQLGNASEQEILVRKKTVDWFCEQAQNWFGVEIEIKWSIDAHSTQKHEILRQQLAEVERQQVQDIVLREQENELKMATKPVVERQREERGYRRERKTDDGPIEPLTVGRSIDEKTVISIHEIVDEMRRAVVEGRVFAVDKRVLPSGRTLIQFNITDETDSISAKLFSNHDRQLEALESLVDGVYVRIAGQVQFDTYAKEIVFMVQDMQPIEAPKRQDLAKQKRSELHLHTTMSALDGVAQVSTLIKQAAAWGHPAIAITDHGVVQSFPEAYQLGKKHGIKVLLGLEAYVVDDGTPIVYRSVERSLQEETTYVVFDTETTGLNAREDTLIEIAAVKVRNGEMIDSFAKLIDPKRQISPKISDLTGITPEMLVGQPTLEQVLPEFREFVEDTILVAHNAEFDVGFLHQCGLRIGMSPWTEPVIDTLSLARAIYPGEKNYRLKTLTQKFQVELVNHHRALADAEATAKVFIHMLRSLREKGYTELSQLNTLAGLVDVSKVRPFHATILVRNQLGLRNLYELVSLSLTSHLYRTPRIPRSELTRLREGLLFGTACQQGELFQAFLRGKSTEEIEEICKFYDYLEIQPPSHYENLLRDELLPSLQSVRQIHQQIVELGKTLQKPVVATGDVHFLYPEDRIYREIFLQSQNQADAANQPPLYLRTTDEMLEEFAFLGADAEAVVVQNPTSIANWIEDVKPIPEELFTPVIEGAEDEIRNLSYAKAHQLYGKQLPEIVEKRLERELASIIGHGFAVIYLIAHKLVAKSLSDGYLVGSRGSVGSSLVATMTEITEVNPLPPHYRCPSCQYSEFFEDGRYGSGFDLPKRNCPACGYENMERDGQDIPFETFLGFEGDKVPDIDLNFSGEYQPRAHKYTEELFGRDHVFRAGTISAVAEKTAYGYVRKFADERGLILRNAEMDRLVKGCTGVKRTTGQHPGGQVVVPGHVSIYDFTPVQYPADDKDAGTLTTHFDYHSGLEHCLLKLDILGHDDPTVIRMLQDLTGVDPKSIPFDDPDVLALFRGTESLGVKQEEIRSVTGTYAIPEFGTKFVRQMLEDTKPTTFSELVRISGLSHGTDVWLNNAQELIRGDVATLSEVICARDDIMVYLIYKGLEPSRAFKIMESIRKGKGVKPEDEEYMRQFQVPEWYIESGKKIKYMFPKAHACAYVIMAVRIAWFKVHYPLAFYAAYFTVRADDFEVELMVRGKDAIAQKIIEIEQKGNAAAPKEKSLLTVLEVALEMVMRGFSFQPVSLYESHATKFLINETQKALIPPFAAIQGVGEAAANNLYQAKEEGPFLSIEDLQSRSRASKTVIEILQGLGCLEGLPDTNQLSLF